VKGTTAATLAGALGAIWSGVHHFSFRTGGTPTYVMPLVFGGAPLVNVLYTMYIHPPDRGEPLLYLGFPHHPPPGAGWCWLLQAAGVAFSSRLQLSEFSPSES